MPPPTGPTAAQVREQIADIGFAADDLTMTDFVITPGSRLFPGIRLDTYCSGTSCSSELEGVGSLEYTTGTLSTITADTTVSPTTPRYGVNTGEVNGRDQLGLGTISADYQVFGGWLDDTFFGAVRANWSGSYEGQSVNGLESIMAFSTGAESGSNPASGSATWTGLMVGLDQRSPRQAVNGQAALTYDFGDNTVDVNFTNLTGPRTYSDLSWSDLDVRNGRFGGGSDSNSLSGTFYGDDHNEVGGVFERSQLIGAFGATRQ